MDNKSKKIIFPDDPEAATPITITVWKSADGYTYFDEYSARYQGATHSKCQRCEKAALKPYILCEACQGISEKEQYEALSKADWDGKAMLYSRTKDEYYESPDEAEDFLEEGETMEDLRLVICTPNHARPLEIDCFEGALPEDGDPPAWLAEAIEAFNEAIKGKEPLSWSPGKIALKRRENDPSRSRQSGR